MTELYASRQFIASRQFMEPQVEALLVEDQETHMDQMVKATKNWLAMSGPVIRRNMRKNPEGFIAGRAFVTIIFSGRRGRLVRGR